MNSIPKRTIFLTSAILATLLFFFQNCGKSGSIGGSNEAVTINTASIPPEDSPAEGGPPSTGGDGAPDTGGTPSARVAPVCFNMSISNSANPQLGSGLYLVQAVGIKQDTLVKVDAAYGKFYYTGDDGQKIGVEDSGVTGGALNFVLPKRDWNTGDLRATFYHETYCGSVTLVGCLQEVPLCSILFTK